MNFNEMLNYDPLLEAEKATGKSYKDDPGTMGLGFLLLGENESRKRDELSIRGDTYHRMPFSEAVDVVLDLGFKPVYVQSLRDSRRKHGSGDLVHFYVYWRSGVLLTLESFDWSNGEMTVNSSSITFNWRGVTNDFSRPDVPITGGWYHRSEGFDDVKDDPWTLVGHADVREGLKHYLDLLEGSGHFLEEWYVTPRILSIHSYVENDDRDSDLPWSKQFKMIDARNLERIMQFDNPARDAILAGRVGASWDD